MYHKFKKTFSLLLLFALCLTGCQSNMINNISDSNSYDPLEEYQLSFGCAPVIQKGTTGYYILANEMLYYYDESLQEAVPVCDKLDCDHTDTSCNASMQSAYEINYYKGNIYYIGSEDDMCQVWYLYSLNEDGRERERITKVATMESGDKGIGFQICVHRRMVYYAVTKVSNLKKRKAYVNCYDLAKNKLDDSFDYYMEGYGATIEDISASGDTLILVGSYAENANNSSVEYTDFIDINTGTCIRNVLKDNNSLISFYNESGMLYCGNINIESNIYRIDATTGDTEKLSTDLPFDADATSTGTHIFSWNDSECRETGDYSDHRIDMYDMDGNIISQIPLKKSYNWEYGDKDSLFAFQYKNNRLHVLIYDLSLVQDNGTTNVSDWKEILVSGGE